LLPIPLLGIVRHASDMNNKNGHPQAAAFIVLS